MNWVQLSLLSAFFAGLVAVLGKLGMKGIDTTLATTARALVMLCTLTVVVFSTGKVDQIAKFSPQSWLYIFLAGLAGAASWLCYFQALKDGDATRVASIDKLSTVVTIALSLIFLGESLNWKVGTGALLIVAGGVLVAL
jgi:transporter family protein